MNNPALKIFLDEKSALYNCPDFIESDPVSVPHRFSKKEDIEISGFFAATIAWGQRAAIIRNAMKLMQMMDESPYDFVMHHSNRDLKWIAKFVHRTFNGSDCMYFIKSLRNIYTNYHGMEYAFAKGKNIGEKIHGFRKIFLSLPHLVRIQKHIADPMANSSAKRLCMYLRWMVRSDTTGVDFGIWKNIKPSELACPLDVHSGRVARALGLLGRNQNDWQAVTDLTEKLKSFDPEDPVKYDFALFGLGVNEKF